MIHGQQDVFLATWWVGYFFSLLNALQDIFSPPHFSAGFFSLKKRVTCLHIQNVLTFIAVFLKTGSTRVLSFLRMFSKGHNIEAMH